MSRRDLQLPIDKIINNNNNYKKIIIVTIMMIIMKLIKWKYQNLVVEFDMNYIMLIRRWYPMETKTRKLFQLKLSDENEYRLLLWWIAVLLYHSMYLPLSVKCLSLYRKMNTCHTSHTYSQQWLSFLSDSLVFSSTSSLSY